MRALPIALLISTIYGIVLYRRDKDTPISRKIFSCAFIGYITGLVCLVIGLELMSTFWHKLFYHMDPGRAVDWFGGDFDLVPDFFNNFSGEAIGNFLMFLPFGILYPLSQKEPTWKKCVIIGLVVAAAIELIQPVFGRAFDMNDIILNVFGIVISTSIFFLAKKILVKAKP